MNKLFGLNNHSKYEVGWKNIASEKKTELKKIMLTHYPFSDVSRVVEVGEQTPGSNNFRMRVSLKNSGSKEVLLRKFIRLRDKTSISLISDVLTFLKNNGVPVPLIIPTKKENYFFSANGNFYQLYEFITGNHYRGTAEELKNVAREIANLHKTLEKIPFKSRIAAKPLGVPPWDMENFNLLFDISETKRKKLDKEISKQKEFILNEAMLVKKSLGNHQCKKQVIHGDLHPHNTLYNGGILKVFIDFEHANANELIREVGNACHRFVRQYAAYQKKSWKHTLPEGLKIFIREYVKENKSAQKEINLMPMFIRDEILRKIFNDLRLYYLEGSAKYLERGEFNKKITLLKEAFEIEKITKSMLL